MAWPVYSEVLLVKALGAGEVWTSWSVPVGKRAVIKSVTMTQWSTDAAQVTVRAGGVYVCVHDFPAAVGQFVFSTMVVVYGGQAIDAFHTRSNVHTLICGYLFDDPSHAVGPPAGVQQLPAPPADPPPWVVP